MYTDQVVFLQVVDFLPMHEFCKCVRRYEGNRRVRSFPCLDPFLCMAFAQMTYRESPRDIEMCLPAMKTKLYHAGIRGRVSRSTLVDANETRDWMIYADYAQVLIGMPKFRIARFEQFNDVNIDIPGFADGFDFVENLVRGVPEPATALLLVCGLLFTLSRRRRTSGRPADALQRHRYGAGLHVHRVRREHPAGGQDERV